MTRFALTALAAGMALAAATPAIAADPYLTIVGGSGTFGNTNVTCTAPVTAPCTFTNTLTFVTPAGYNLTSATISSSQVGAESTANPTNIDFSSVTLNGVNFNIVSTGYVEFRHLLNQAIASGATNTLVVSGTTGGTGSYAGALTFSAAVPEAATWGMMILGFGVMGGVMRRRKTTVAFA